MVELQGVDSFVLTASLLGGQGAMAWQHAQLFRLNMKDTSSFPLELIVCLKRR